MTEAIKGTDEDPRQEPATDAPPERKTFTVEMKMEWLSVPKDAVAVLFFSAAEMAVYEAARSARDAFNAAMNAVEAMDMRFQRVNTHKDEEAKATGAQS